MKRQRGFGVMEMILLAVAAVACIAILHAAYNWVDDTWQTGAGIAEGKRLEHAAMQPKLNACNKSLADADLKIAVQSASIDAAASAAKAQAAEGRRVAAEARAGQAETRTEIQRLGDFIQKGAVATACPAGAAVAKVRQGLK